MPYLNIVTNTAIPDEAELLSIASQTVAKAAGKPESYVMVSVQANAKLIMGGKNAPVAFLDYRALGLPADRTAFSDALCSLITNELGIAGDRIYISMTDSERQNWGWNHATF
jgi:phenylpyruvate tautomerase PptA (4-oxalocrotonate tautomerase family)